MTADGARTAEQLASILGATLLGDGQVQLSGMSGMEDASPTDLTFIRNAQYASRWAQSNAGAAIITRGLETDMPTRPGAALIVVDDADRAMMQLLEFLRPEHSVPDEGIHPGASIHPDAIVAPDSRVDASVSVGAHSSVGKGAVLHAGARIGANVSLGANVVCHPNVVVYDNCTIHDNVTIHAGAVIGAEGFGFHPRADGTGVEKIPHVGAVRIEEGVEIGANACIDRGKFSDTVIGRHSKVDNLVQIGHGCRVGQHCLICGQAALAGSVVLGDGVTIAGGAGIADNVRIGDGARVGAKSGVMSDIPAGETWFGYPAMGGKEYFSIMARVRKLPSTLKRLEALIQSGRSGD
ncbi:MAG: UDP-3-O-(3-hydroxymyristoyl)glucosamine N-acyltransferase [Phycisphaerales bacterium JB043]